jgi:hypothetical protein
MHESQLAPAGQYKSGQDSTAKTMKSMFNRASESVRAAFEFDMSSCAAAA